MALDAQLVATCWTTAGSEVAAAAGFTAIGVSYADLLAARAHYGDSEIRAILDDHGIEHFGIEVLTGWYVTGEHRRSSDERRHVLLDAADSLGAQLIKVIGEISGSPADMFGFPTGPLCPGLLEGFEDKLLARPAPRRRRQAAAGQQGEAPAQDDGEVRDQNGDAAQARCGQQPPQHAPPGAPRPVHEVGKPLPLGLAHGLDAQQSGS